jgi:3-hydroxyisobutyrate dehydrogenase-like beta-hydroxyacid dehydrogenase
MSQEIGLIGLGLMGSALAQRLLASGFRVVGFDLDAAKRQALESAGGESAASVAEIARRCGTVLIAVLRGQQVEQVIEGEGGLLTGGRPLTLLCAATCEPALIASLAERVMMRGATLLDTPVSGSSGQVMKGEGLGLIGGDLAAAERCEDVLAAIYPRRIHVGPAGHASRAKLAINLALGLNRLALAETLVFAERLGLDPSAFLAIARQSAAYSQIMDVKGAKMIEGDFSPQGRIVQSRKDFGLIIGEARRAGQRLPLAEVLMDILESCVTHGEGDWDNSAVIQEVRRRRS